MSSIHANGIFDVILTAGKTGGVTGRQKAVRAGFITRQGDLIDAALREEIDANDGDSLDDSLFDGGTLLTGHGGGGSSKAPSAVHAAPPVAG